ncbi:MAG: hypothetical protein ACOYNF_16855 [Rhodoferax sp.]
MADADLEHVGSLECASITLVGLPGLAAEISLIFQVKSPHQAGFFSGRFDLPGL